jgi:3-dehydroquinate synthase
VTHPTAVRSWEEIPQDAAGLDIGPGSVLVYDDALEATPAFASLRDAFEIRYPVAAGEALKDLAAFPGHVERILGRVTGLSRSDIRIVAAGGGSVGDFGGFAASVLLRGVEFVNVPTTWLAAIDSAHGGKTALNSAGFKNQIGTFHPAAEVWIFRSLLVAVPAAETRAAYGELIKMAMLSGGELFAEVAASGIGADELWRLLPSAIAAKASIVALDPREETGHRQLLNLGHTLGHALESHFGIAHGVAVGSGLRFCVEWSRARGYLADTEADGLLSLLDRFEEFGQQALPPRPPLSRSRLTELLDRDKKATGPGEVTFVFLDSTGAPRLEAVAIAAIVDEAQRQGWL